MGIVNVTPDSFSDGGQFFERERAIDHGLAMAQEGADIIDVGGESTRPYSDGVSKEEEMDRVIPVIEALRKEVAVPISIDTIKAEVAREALRAGASMINDISALRFDPEMVKVAAAAKVPVVLMHMKGTPSDMQKDPTYERLIPEILAFLEEAVRCGLAGGIQEEMIIVDPGIGFGKTFDQNLEVIRDLHRFHSLGRPILLGTSRKAFLGHILNKQTHERDAGTMATVAAGVLNGAHIVRVHNVKKAIETVKVIDAVKRGRASDPAG
ncbi:MAG: dihydropteroate synthase [Proteobacteria bacterium]|nr:dihydropteroate synthase [Pseudomonadota bacterium]